MTCEPTKSSSALDLPVAFERQLKFPVKPVNTPGWKACAWHLAKERDANTFISQGYTWALERRRQQPTGFLDLTKAKQ